MLVIIEESGIPARMPAKIAVISNATNALSLNFSTMRSSNRTAEITMKNIYSGDITGFRDEDYRLRILFYGPDLDANRNYCLFFPCFDLKNPGKAVMNNSVIITEIT